MLLATLAIAFVSGCGKTGSGGSSGPSAGSVREYIDQPNLAQVGVDPTLHDSLTGFLAPADESSEENGDTTWVAILDGLVDAAHPDLAGLTSILNVYSSTAAPENHATHVAGIIGASRDGAGVVGVNPYVGLLNIPVFSGGRWIADNHAEAALAAAVSEGAVVANMSYGSGGGDVFTTGELDVIAGFVDSLVIV
ncbi:MAG: S8 family serine peptidase, partial [bacterium]